MNQLAPTIEFIGLTIDLAAIAMITLTCIIVFVIAKIATRKLSVDRPSKMQNFLEWVVDFVKGIIANAMDMKKGKAFVALAVTLIMFIFIGNMLSLPLGIVTKHSEPLVMFGHEVGMSQEEFEAEGFGPDNKMFIAWYKSPTSDPAVTIGLALMMVFLAHFLGATKYTKSYFKGFVKPFPLFLPINIIGEISKILTLGMRLFGNIFAGGVMFSTFIMAGAAGILGLVPWMGFSVFVGAIQAFIFTMLSMVYLAQQIDVTED